MLTVVSQGRPEVRFAVVVMGVAGCGKTTFGRALAQVRGLPFFDGDEAQWWDAPQASIPMIVGASVLKKATISLRRSFLRNTTFSVAFTP